MNANECRHTRREIDELEFGAEPGQSAQAHLALCEACRKFSAERAELRELVGTLEPVVAPADFDMRLRARIAAQRSSSRRLPFFARFISTPALAAATLFVIVAGTVVWISQRQSSSPATPTRTTATFNPTEPANPPATEGGNAAAGAGVVAVNAGNGPRRIRSTAKSPQSRDYGVGPAPRIVQNDTDQAYVNAPSKPVVFSLEDERGTTRKISLPPVTFGAQNLVDNRMPVSYSGNSRVW